MAYNTKTNISFKKLLSALLSNNRYVHSIFCKKALTGEKWELYCLTKSEETEEVFLLSLERFLLDLDEDLYNQCVSLCEKQNLDMEVRKHFDQDKNSLELWQEFEIAVDNPHDTFNDCYQTWRNEY